MSRIRKYRSFQIYVAPGVYGGSTLLGAFIYFLSGYQWLATVIVWILIGGISYLDKPFKFILLNKKSNLLMFLCLISLSLFLPPAVFLLGSAFGELVGMILIPVGGLSVGAFVYLVYREDILQREGWTSISG